MNTGLLKKIKFYCCLAISLVLILLYLPALIAYFVIGGGKILLTAILGEFRIGYVSNSPSGCLYCISCILTGTLDVYSTTE